jgi:hypothetical protein
MEQNLASGLGNWVPQKGHKVREPTRFGVEVGNESDSEENSLSAEEGDVGERASKGVCPG